MTVTSAKRKFEGQKGNVGWDWDTGLEVAFSEKWIVISNDSTDTWVEILNDSSVPQIGEEYIVDGNPTGYYVIGIAHEQNDENPLLWELDVSVESPQPGNQGQAGQPIKNPLSRPVGVDWRIVKREVPSFYDLDGNPFVNSAGDPYDKPLMIPINSLTKIVTKNVASFKPETIRSYNDVVNEDDYDGAEEYSLLLTVEPSAKQTENDVDFYTLTFEIAHNPYLWHPYKEPDVGNRYKNASGDFVRAEDGGIWHDSIIRLDGTGKKLADDQALKWNEFKKYRAKKFKGFIPV